MSNSKDKTMRDQSLVRPRQEDDGQQGDSRDVRQASPADLLKDAAKKLIDSSKTCKSAGKVDVSFIVEYVGEIFYKLAKWAEREGWTRTR